MELPNKLTRKRKQQQILHLYIHQKFYISTKQISGYAPACHTSHVRWLTDHRRQLIGRITSPVRPSVCPSVIRMPVSAVCYRVQCLHIRSRSHAPILFLSQTTPAATHKQRKPNLSFCLCAVRVHRLTNCDCGCNSCRLQNNMRTHCTPSGKCIKRTIEK